MREPTMVRHVRRVTFALLSTVFCSAPDLAPAAFASDGAPRGAGAFALMPPASGGQAPLMTSAAATREKGVAPIDPVQATVQPPGPTAADIQALLARLRPGVLRAGVSPATFDRLAATIKPEPAVLQRLGAQPELVRPISGYIQALVSDARIAGGRRLLAEHQPLLSRIEAAYGVPAPVLVAIWGIESLYGMRPGTVPILDALATLTAAGGRRQAFWQQQLIGAFRLVERGDVKAEALVGSWAGALGHTQFIPTTYLARAVDFDGDGRRDIVGSVGDALASTAHYLRASGWQPGAPWGIEVKLPAVFDFIFAAPGRARAVELWDQLKVRRADGSSLPRLSGDLQLVLPAGAGGPAFLVTGNYRALLAYNNAMAYALAVGILADRIAGGGGLIGAWTDDTAPLVHDERREVQRHLAALGHAVGEIDGVMGDGTRSAIRAYQSAGGLAADGHPDRDLLERLRADVAGSVMTP